MTLATFQVETASLAAAVKNRARDVGFDLVGIGPAEPSRYRDYLRQWLDTGQAGSMSYLSRRFDERTDPAAYLPGAASVVCVAMNYFVPLEPLQSEDHRRHGRIARYALGDDYHELMKSRLHELADAMRELLPGTETRACVDTAPVMEKEVAARSGIGWVGKNTCLINPEIGSWLLLGEVITTARLAPDEPALDHCGSCTRCLDACPTGAITAPYQLDARRCIAYLTIEHREAIDPSLQSLMGDWLYGCDICQDVCPYNHKASATSDPALAPRFPTGTLDVEQVLGWDEPTYRSTLLRSAMKRVKLPMLLRNAAIVNENLAGRENSR